jgi:hypothetical protein
LLTSGQIKLFLNKVDYASAITLAGAAGDILHHQVIFSSKIPLLEETRLFCKELIGSVPKRSKYLKHFGDFTGINRLKHKSKECPDVIVIDLEKSAELAITRAILDYIKLYGDTDPYVIRFMNFLWVTKGARIMEGCRTLPEEKPVDIKKHDVLDLATAQLKSSICLFLTGRDLFSSITLAGAADVLLCRIVENRGEENFTEHVQKSEDNSDKTREDIGKEINDIFHINSLKHMDHKDDISVTMNLRSAAYGAILKTLPNLKIICGLDHDFVKAFLLWIKANLDPEIYNIEFDPNWQSKPE